MAAKRSKPLVLVGPRSLDDRICRLVYVRETDEAWTEEWSNDAWVRTSALVRHVLKAPAVTPAVLRRRGVPVERGVWDQEQVVA